jgi:hypothetical protein
LSCLYCIVDRKPCIVSIACVVALAYWNSFRILLPCKWLTVRLLSLLKPEEILPVSYDRYKDVPDLTKNFDNNETHRCSFYTIIASNFVSVSACSIVRLFIRWSKFCPVNVFNDFFNTSIIRKTSYLYNTWSAFMYQWI